MENNTKTKQYRIHGIIKTTAPLHIASPRKKRIDPQTGYEAFGQGGIPCTPVVTMDLPFAREIRFERDGAEEVMRKQMSVPVIPANNINGHLRRHAAALIFDAMGARGEKVSIGTYSAMTCGAVTGSPDAGMIKFDEYREARQNVFLGLFGGGPRMIRRNVRVHNIVPITDETIEAGLHSGSSRHPKMDGPVDLAGAARIKDGIRSIVQNWTFLRKDDLKSLVDIDRQESVIDDYLNKITEYQAKILEEQTKGKDGDRLSTFTFTAMEFVVPGIMFPTTFELDVTDAQMGLFLLALDRFAAKDRIGGCTRNGFGQFLFQHMMLVDVDSDKTDTIEEIFKDGRLNKGSKLVEQFLAAYQQAVQDLSVDRLNFLMRPPVETDRVKEKKAAKAAKAAKVAAD